MLHKSAFFRIVAIPACMVWGVLEFFALQRARLLSRRGPRLGRYPASALGENA